MRLLRQQIEKNNSEISRMRKDFENKTKEIKRQMDEHQKKFTYERALRVAPEHYEKELDIEDLARLAFMSKSYFITQFKTFFQITPKQYLNLVRVQRACYLLTATDDSVVKIALKVGFGNPVYFTELFTRINGESPTEYRRSRGVSGR
jgi:AraC-like DNA-binding protein